MSSSPPSGFCSSLPAMSDIWPTCCIALCTPCMMPCGTAAAMPIICKGIWAACCAICIGMPIICPSWPACCPASAAGEPAMPADDDAPPAAPPRRPRTARATGSRIELTQTPQDLLGNLTVGVVVGTRGVQHVLRVPGQLFLGRRQRGNRRADHFGDFACNRHRQRVGARRAEDRWRRRDRTSQSLQPAARRGHQRRIDPQRLSHRPPRPASQQPTRAKRPSAHRQSPFWHHSGECYPTSNMGDHTTFAGQHGAFAQ